MVLTIEGGALEDYPHSVSSLLQHNPALKENSARLVGEKTQVVLDAKSFLSLTPSNTPFSTSYLTSEHVSAKFFVTRISLVHTFRGDRILSRKAS